MAAIRDVCNGLFAVTPAPINATRMYFTMLRNAWSLAQELSTDAIIFVPTHAEITAPPMSEVLIRNIHQTLECGHVKTELLCWQVQKPTMVQCNAMDTHIVPGCSYETRLLCGSKVTDKGFKCSSICGEGLSCGRLCRGSFHACRKSSGDKFFIDSGTCLQVCDRNYSTCNHRCLYVCHGDEACPLCSAPCEVCCSHSRCDKRCSEPCAPCAEERCASVCPHSRCTMPCAAPCDWVPCSLSCEKIFACGHRCPSVCGEQCPDQRFCQECANEEVKDIRVDYIEGMLHRAVDLDNDPCIFPQCGHIITLSNMDGHMNIPNHYFKTKDGVVLET